MASPTLLDSLVIGGGAAGLTAAIYLARFRRDFIVLDGDASRLRYIPTSHNYPGFTDGIHGHDILARLRAQAARYGASVICATVDHLERQEDGTFVAHCGKQQWRARTVILATGVVDVEPRFPDVRRAVAEGCVRYCPICDGYESIGKKVAVIGHGNGGLGEAIFVRHFADEVTLFSVDAPITLTDEEKERTFRASVNVSSEPVTGFAYDESGAMRLYPRNGVPLQFDVIYVALGTILNSGLAQALGATVTEEGEVVVDAHQRTSVHGLYAAGDVVKGLNQISVAMGHAAIAATAIHNQLNSAKAA